MYLTSVKYRVIISQVAHGDEYLSQSRKYIKKVKKLLQKVLTKGI